MANFDAVALFTPMCGKEIGDEAAVAFFGAGLGAKKRDFRRTRRSVQFVRDVALLQPGQKRGFVGGPVLCAALAVEELRWRSEPRVVGVGDAGDFLEKETKIGMLGEAGKLAGAFLADVDNLLDAGVLQQGEEFLGGFSSEADGAEEILHGTQKYSRDLGEPRKANSLASSWKASSNAKAPSATKTQPVAKTRRPRS